MAGVEKEEVILPDGSKEERKTTLCCQAVCFVSIDGVADVLDVMNADLPKEMETEVRKDRIDFFLVVYFLTRVYIFVVFFRPSFAFREVSVI